MGNKEKDKKRQRVISSGAENNNDDQDGAFIKMTVKEYQDLLGKLTAIEDQAKARDARILNLESRLDEAQAEIDRLKLSVTETTKAMTETKQFLEFTQGEQVDI